MVLKSDFENLKVGDEFPSLIKPPINNITLIRYAGASGDFNPIHTIDMKGKEAGFGGVIAHGMLIMAYAGQAIGHWFPRKNLKKFSVRFIKVTRLDESIVILGRVEKIILDRKKVICSISAENACGEQKLTGQFEIVY